MINPGRYWPQNAVQKRSEANVAWQFMCGRTCRHCEYLLSIVPKILAIVVHHPACWHQQLRVSFDCAKISSWQSIGQQRGQRAIQLTFTVLDNGIFPTSLPPGLFPSHLFKRVPHSTDQPLSLLPTCPVCSAVWLFPTHNQQNISSACSRAFHISVSFCLPHSTF